MTTIKSFVTRLKKIGIEVELFGNYPWVYLTKVNGRVVKEKMMAEHGFTVFFLIKNREQITDIKEIFKVVRKYIKPKCKLGNLQIG